MDNNFYDDMEVRKNEAGKELHPAEKIADENAENLELAEDMTDETPLSTENSYEDFEDEDGDFEDEDGEFSDDLDIDEDESDNY